MLDVPVLEASLCDEANLGNISKVVLISGWCFTVFDDLELRVHGNYSRFYGVLEIYKFTQSLLLSWQCQLITPVICVG